MINCIKVIKRICKRYTEIENYEIALNDKTQTWVCHHRREVQDGFRIWTKEELIKVGQYYHRKPNELIFMTKSEHTSLHNNAIDPKTKKPCCYRDRDITGKNNPMYGKKGANLGKKFSIKTCNKISIAKSSHWINNYGYTRRDLVKLLPLTIMNIRTLDKSNPDKLKEIIKETLGG